MSGGGLGDLERARALIATLEQLLEAQERTSIDQTDRLHQSLRERDELVGRMRAARDDAERARAALSASDARLRLALEAGRMGTWEWDIEGDRVVWSPQLERMLGLPEGSFAGTLEAYRAHIHPDDRERALARVQAALAARAPTHHVVHRVLCADGSVRWLESHGRFLYADDGRPLRLVGVSADVTARTAVEEARDRALAEARHERERLRDVFMQAPASISVTEGPEHVTVVQNELSRRLVGNRNMIGRPVREVFPELDGQGFFELLDRVYATGEPFVGTEMVARFDRDGDGLLEEGYFNFVYQPLTDTAGHTFGIMTHAVEVTEQVLARREVERKAAELARLTHDLEQSNRELDQFAYVASHDLKAPLRGIANLSQWIAEDAGERLPAESREHFRLLQGRVHRMEALIDGILAYSRAGRVRGAPETVESAALVREVVELLAIPPGARVEVAPNLPVVTAERVPLQQVFLNLIGNAIKHGGGDAARVRVDCRDGGAVWEFSVADNGPGIAPAYHERIWQIFQTLEARDQVEGTGIGLSVVKKIVEARGGRVRVESDLGRGATFVFEWRK